MTDPKALAEKISNLYWQETTHEKFTEVIESLLAEALKKARREWMSKSDPFVTECILLAEQEAYEKAAQVAEKYGKDNFQREAMDTRNGIAAAIRAEAKK